MFFGRKDLLKAKEAPKQETHTEQTKLTMQGIDNARRDKINQANTFKLIKRMCTREVRGRSTQTSVLFLDSASDAR